MPSFRMRLQEARAVMEQIGQETRALVNDQYRILNVDLLPALAESGVRLVSRDDRTAEQRAWTAKYFHDEVRPLLTPIGLDPAHPFPQVGNKSLNFVIELSGSDAFGRDSTIATIQASALLSPHSASYWRSRSASMS